MVSIDTYACNTKDDALFFSSTEYNWKQRILKLAEEHPDEVTIIKRPEENDGCIYAKMPVSYLKLQPKRKIEMTDEEREVMMQRMRQMTEKRKQKQTADQRE